ncbi:hypothetical protein [Nostoc sp.]|uniref:hypothetical protein n=1 Tax=Nostoc sp. TaxID=1180 RepID=UPI002FF97142
MRSGVMLIEKVHRFNFLSFEEYIDFTVGYTSSLLGRCFKKAKDYDNKTNSLILDYEDELYRINIKISTSYYIGKSIRKDINYEEGLPYHHKHKDHLYRKEWHETEEGFISDLRKMIYSIMSIDENGKTIGIVRGWHKDKNYGYLKTYNCGSMIFYVSEIHPSLIKLVRTGSILRFRQRENCIRIKNNEYLQAIDFDNNYIKYDQKIPIEELPGYILLFEKRELIIKNTQKQFDGTETIAPILYALLEYKNTIEHFGKEYVGKWNSKEEILYLIDKKTQLIKMTAKRNNGFIYQYDWMAIYPKQPFKNITENDIKNFTKIKLYLEQHGIDVQKRVLS